MENKYYTPTMEEFHVGFEYLFSSAYQEGISATEITIDGRDGYEPEIFNFNIYNFIPNKGESWKDIFESMLAHDQCKVKYLDKEDIESFGWVDYIKGNLRWYTKGGYRLVYNDINHRVHIELYTPAEDGQPEFIHRLGVLFAGIIKNKSELVVLLKQLGI